MKITFLEAALPLTKHFHKRPDATIEKTAYPNIRNFISHTHHDVKDPEQFHELVESHAQQGHCLLKGLLDKDLVDESRRGRHLRSERTEWMCLDFDGATGFDSIDDALYAFGIGDASYIVQQSASARIKDGLNAHVFIMLSAPIDPTLLKLWLQATNFRNPVLHNGIKLQSCGTGLLYPLDITVCQNDKLLYIAPPTFFGMEDPFAEEPRIQLIRKQVQKLNPDTLNGTINSPFNKLEVLNRLRHAVGLRPKTPKTAYSKTLRATVVTNPDQAVVTEVIDQNEFVRLNLNGGDSGAYWHWKNNPSLIYNFKDTDIVYPTEKFLPEYYVLAKARAQAYEEDHPTVKEDPQGIQRFVMTHKDLGKYYKVEYNPNTRNIDLSPAHLSMTLVQDWCAEHSIPVPILIPTWEVGYNPGSTVTIDTDNKFINLYKPSPYKLNATKRDAVLLPANYLHLVTHVVGDDADMAQRLLHWIAYIWQTSRKPKTAWIWHGTQGTGKGLLFEVLRQLFGHQNAVETSVQLLLEQFNGQLETAQLVLVDEADIDNVTSQKLEPKLKQWITSTNMPIRAMRKDTVNKPSYFGMIFASNKADPARIDPADRRFHVPPRQDTPYGYPSQELYDALYTPQNLQQFADYLESLAYDEQLVNIAAVTEAKEEIMEASITSPEHLLHSLRTGDFDDLAGYLPTKVHMNQLNDHRDYAEVMKYIYDKLAGLPDNTPASVTLSREDLQIIFNYVADIRSERGKFTNMLRRMGLAIKPIRQTKNGDSNLVRGSQFEFRASKEAKAQFLKAITTESTMQVVK